jgi:hypothetical protein
MQVVVDAKLECEMDARKERENSQKKGAQRVA